MNRKDKIKELILNSNRIHLMNKQDSILKCKCGNCSGTFETIGYMKRKKIVCPACRRIKLSGLKREKRGDYKAKTAENDYTPVKRRCAMSIYCAALGDLCGSCAMKTRPFYTRSELNQELVKQNNHLAIKENFVDLKTNITCACNNCGKIFKAKPYDLLNGAVICDKCGDLSGEKEVQSYLMDNEIPYEVNKAFENNTFYFPFVFDFYLPCHNLLIDFADRGHYEPYTHFGTQDEKKKFCKDNSFHYIIISKNDQEKIKKLSPYLDIKCPD